MSNLDNCLSIIDKFFEQKEIEICQNIDKKFQENVWQRQYEIDSQIDLKLEQIMPTYKKQIQEQNKNPQDLVDFAQKCVRQEMSNSFQNQVQPLFENQVVNISSQIYNTFYKGFQFINKELEEPSLQKSHNQQLNVTEGSQFNEEFQQQQQNNEQQKDIGIDEKFEEFKEQLQEFGRNLDQDNKQLKYDLKTFYKPLDKNHKHILEHEQKITQFLNNEEKICNNIQQTLKNQDKVLKESKNINDQYNEEYHEIQAEKERNLKQQQIEISFQRSQKRNDSISSLIPYDNNVPTNVNNSMSMPNFVPQPLVRTTSENMGNFNNTNNQSQQIPMNSSQNIYFNSPQQFPPQEPLIQMQQDLQNNPFIIPSFNSSDTNSNSNNNNKNRQQKQSKSNSVFLLKQKSKKNQKQFMSQQNSSEDEEIEDIDEDLENDVDDDLDNDNNSQGSQNLIDVLQNSQNNSYSSDQENLQQE